MKNNENNWNRGRADCRPPFPRDFRLGQEAIVNASAFRDNRLRLCIRVPLRDLSAPGQDRIWSTGHSQDGSIDYLICSSRWAMMAIQVIDPEQDELPPTPIPYLLCVRAYAWSMEDGLVDGVLDKLDTLLYTGFRPIWSCQLEEISPHLAPLLVQAHLAEFSGQQLLPTESGAIAGLVTTIEAPAGVARAQWSRRVRNLLLPSLLSGQALPGSRHDAGDASPIYSTNFRK